MLNAEYFNGLPLNFSTFRGNRFCVGFDIDPEALRVAEENRADFELEDRIDFVKMDIKSCGIHGKVCDVTIMNPPFGTKENAEGIDMVFLDQAMRMSRECVYSIHKSSTRQFIQKHCEQNNWNMKVLLSFDFELPKTYKFHKKGKGNIKHSIALTLMGVFGTSRQGIH